MYLQKIFPPLILHRVFPNYYKIVQLLVKFFMNSNFEFLNSNFCRFFYGKNKVMAVALGKSEETEIKDGLHKLSSNLVGEVGLLFTSKSKEDVDS